LPEELNRKRPASAKWPGRDGQARSATSTFSLYAQCGEAAALARPSTENGNFGGTGASLQKQDVEATRHNDGSSRMAPEMPTNGASARSAGLGISGKGGGGRSRMRTSLHRMRELTGQNRESWASVRAETSNFRPFLAEIPARHCGNSSR